MAAGPDVVEVLAEDHRQIECLLRDVADGDAASGEAAGGEAAGGEAAGGEAVDRDDERRLSVGLAELARHIVVEEAYLYPLIREILPDGDRVVGHELSLSRHAERLMQQLQRSAPASPERRRLAADLVGVIAEHAQTTERTLFPVLRDACAAEVLEHLAGVVEMAKRTAPTRAHPGMPDTAPWSQILSPGVGLVDKVRDAVTRRPTKPDEL